MSFKPIYDKEFFALPKRYSIKDIADFAFENSLYKIDILKTRPAEMVGEYSFGSETCSVSTAKYPENAFKLDLKKGEYVLAYKDGGVLSKISHRLNDNIKGSLSGSIEFDEMEFTDEELDGTNDSNYIDKILAKGYKTNKVYRFKITGKNKLHLWINEENPENVIGRFNFYIFKVDSEFKESETSFTTIINTAEESIAEELEFDLPAGEHKLIVFDVYSSGQEEMIRPRPKYPIGTYQLTFRQCIASSNDQAAIESAIALDRSKYDLNAYDKITSMKNIIIPEDADPMKRYVMIGKVSANICIDLLNDTYFIYPVSCAECFMNLFVPKCEFTKIEETSSYILYNVVDYILIWYDYKDTERIKDAIMRWLKCDRNSIKVDEHSLYYHVYDFNFYEWYYSRYASLIMEHFLTVELFDIIAEATDNISMASPDFEMALPYVIKSCKWRIADSSVIAKANKVDWRISNEWTLSENDENVIKLNAYGEGVIRITKEHFSHLTNTNLDNINIGALNDEQFRSLKLNGPMINAHERFQYWMNIKL